MAAPNIVNVATIKGNTNVATLGATTGNIVTNAASSGKVFKINTVILANFDGTTAYDATLTLYSARAGVTKNLVSTISVPADASLVVLDKTTALYMEEGDILAGFASAASKIDATVSFEEIS
jgi:hypothetical protein